MRFEQLGIEADDYEELWVGNATPEQRHEVLQFLVRVRFSWGMHKAMGSRQESVYGRAHGSDRGDQPGEPGLLAEANEAVNEMIAAIDRFDKAADKIRKEVSPFALRDKRMTLAQPHLKEARKVLTTKQVEVDPRLRRRTRGHPPGLVISLRPGEKAEPRKRRDLEQHLRELLKESGHHTRGSATRLARRLLDQVLPSRWRVRQRG